MLHAEEVELFQLTGFALAGRRGDYRRWLYWNAWSPRDEAVANHAIGLHHNASATTSAILLNYLSFLSSFLCLKHFKAK